MALFTHLVLFTHLAFFARSSRSAKGILLRLRKVLLWRPTPLRTINCAKLFFYTPKFRDFTLDLQPDLKVYDRGHDR